MLLGILSFKSDWSVDSNREFYSRTSTGCSTASRGGDGYYDIQIEIEDEGIGIIIEVKYAENGQLEEACKEALQQINDRNYAAELIEDDMHTILKYGIACYKKQCKVVKEI